MPDHAKWQQNLRRKDAIGWSRVFESSGACTARVEKASVTMFAEYMTAVLAGAAFAGMGYFVLFVGDLRRS